MLAPAMLLAITVHEYAHGWMAWRRGDDTASRMGRLSMNPLVHLDLFGTIVLLVTGFIGWAKPVPVDPRRLRSPASDMVWVALAGPAANLLLMVVFILLVKLAILAEAQLLSVMSLGAARDLLRFLLLAAMLNLGLCVFNLLPVPPLDGFRVAAYFLPRTVVANMFRFQLVFFILLILLMRSGYLSPLFDKLRGAVLSLV